MTPSATQAINWFEIPCADLARGQRFYEAVLGRRMPREDFGDGAMVLFAHDQPSTGGCLVQAAGRVPAADGGVRIYLDCEPGLDAAVARTAAAGGQVVDACIALPRDLGFIAHVRDTEGNTVGLHAMAR